MISAPCGHIEEEGRNQPLYSSVLDGTDSLNRRALTRVEGSMSQTVNAHLNV
jgi:hypothetical protein